jgi:FMN reductase
MFDVIAIAGSPSHPSRSAAILEHMSGLIRHYGLRSMSIAVRDIHAEDLLWGRFDSPSIQQRADLIGRARGVVIATPVYKAAYSGVLKAFLDILPQQILAGKIVLPIATGGSIAHLLAIDYALKPVLAALGARYVLGGVYAVDSQIQRVQNDHFHMDPDLELRLDTAAEELVEGIRCHGQHDTVETSAAPLVAVRAVAGVSQR